MQAEDRSRTPARKSYWGRSTLASLTTHGLLVSIGLAVPLVWTGSRQSQVSATVWAELERPRVEPFEETPEPNFEIEPPELPFEDPTVVSVPVVPEPFPELEPPDPLEPVDWADDGLRRATLDPIFRAPIEPAEPVQVATAPEVIPPPTPAADTSPQPVEVDALALAEFCPAPIYPRRAQRMGWYGTVVCSLTVGADGVVSAVLLLQSSGHGLLDESVLRTVHGWRFAPATCDGVPTETQVIRRFRFDLPS